MRTMMKNELEKVNGGYEPMIIEQRVTYYDENGNPYTIIVRSEEDTQPDIIGMKVTYSDGNGNTYTIEKCMKNALISSF